MALRSNEHETGGSRHREWFPFHIQNARCHFAALCPQGFDEFMNIVMDDAEEVFVKTDARKQIGAFIFPTFDA